LNRGLVVFSAVGSVIVLFLVFPLVLLLFLSGGGLAEFIGDSEAINAILLSFHSGVVASLIVVLFGTPLSYVLSRWRSRFVRVVQGLIEIPLALPHSVAGIMVLLAYNSRAPVGSVLSRFGLVVEDSYWGIVFVMVFVSAPIFVSSVKAGFDMVDVELENVARTLGASLTQVFLRVSLPLVYKHILAGFILCLARAISEVGAVMVVAYYPKVAATLVIERFLGYGLGAALSLSGVLVIISLVIFAALRLILAEE